MDLEQLWSRFDANRGQPQPVREPHEGASFSVMQTVPVCYGEATALESLEEVRPLPISERVVLIGGGRTIEQFDFRRLRHLDATVIGINSGTQYHPCDVLFYSGSVNGVVADKACRVNGGVVAQLSNGWADRPQTVVMPYLFQTGDARNVPAVTAARELGCELTTVEYSDLWAWNPHGHEVGFDLFAKAIRKRRLYGAGPDFGFMACMAAIMHGARELYLVGFDGRFIDGEDEPSVEGLFEAWAGDQTIYAEAFGGTVTQGQYDFLVTARNEINETLFGWLRAYCAEHGIVLKWLTPSIHATRADYKRLKR